MGCYIEVLLIILVQLQFSDPAIYLFHSIFCTVLRNDHKDITEKINQNIQVLHSARLPSATAKETGNIAA